LLSLTDEGGWVEQAGIGISTEGGPRPHLLYFTSATSGRCRRVDGFLAQVLQRHRNHDRFRLVRVTIEKDDRLARHFDVTEVPTLIVVDQGRVRARIESPAGSRAIEARLSRWLR
jgi:thioredoxin-like negative regulator of GroEL